MNIGQFLQIAKEVIVALEAANILKVGGEFDFSNLAGDAALAKSIEEIFKSHGAAIPARVDQFLIALPLVIQFFK